MNRRGFIGRCLAALPVLGLANAAEPTTARIVDLKPGEVMEIQAGASCSVGPRYCHLTRTFIYPDGTIRTMESVFANGEKLA